MTYLYWKDDQRELDESGERRWNVGNVEEKLNLLLSRELRIIAEIKK